jgi:hypothetical protein
MANKNYNSSEAKDTLLCYLKNMTEAWEDFLINKETVSAILVDIKAHETEESYNAILTAIGFSVKDADDMIAAYREEVNNG